MPIYTVCNRCRCRVEKYGKHKCVGSSTNRTTQHKTVYNTSRWKKIVNYCISIEPMCARCGSNESLRVHHIRHVDKEPDYAFDINNLVNLCDSCHKEVHSICRSGQLDFKHKPMEYNYIL